MPLTKHRGFRLSILCDVFLLLSFQVETFLTAIVLNLPISSGLELNNTYNYQPILYTDDGKDKSPEKFDTYKDFNDDEIHRILRDEESAYKDDESNIQTRSISSDSIFYRIQKRSTNVNSVDLYFDNRNNTESSDHSTKVVDLSKKNLTQHAINRFLNENLTEISWNEDVVLNLSSNCLNDFQVENVKKFKNLQHLDLSWNNLTKFMLNNSTLRILNLSWNQVSNFSSGIENNNLKELYLRNNNLSSIEHLELSKLNHLQILDLSCNQITEVENYFFRNLKTLHQLNLSRNRLGYITKDLFYNLLNIDNLILSYNNISAIDLDTFMDLPNLQYLDLSHNNIQSGSVRALQGIPDLVGLSIAYNFDLSDSLQEFVSTWSLKELDASGTGLCRIPAALAQSVRALKLVDNWFSVIRCGDLDSYPLLQYLDLSSCHINEIEEDALGRLEILETLFLDHNNLRRVPISLPTTLVHLFLHNNQIMDIQPSTFQSLSNLRTLDLSENKLIYLPGLPLPKLLTLNLQSSELRGLSQSVVKTSPKLKDLLLEGNPIRCSDLLGIAEWASPCRNDRIVQENDIKGHFQRMHNHFQTFQSNQECQNDCIYTDYRNQSRRKPKCADSNIKFIQSNKLESQLQGMEDIIASGKIIDVNLLHFLTSFLQQASEKIRSKNFTEEEQNFIQEKPEIFSRQQYNQSRTFLLGHNISTKNFPLANENTVVGNESVQHHSRIVGPFSGSKGGHINEKSSFEPAKTPILSFSYNLYKSRGNITAQQSGGGWRKSENVTQEHQQHRATLSKIKSDNNYVETSVLLGQESQAGDGINEGKLVVQVGNHDPTDSNFKSGNIDSVPKVKDNILLNKQQNFLNGTLGVTILHKIDESNTNKLETINRTGMYPKTKTIAQMAVIIPENVYPSVKTQQLSENSGKKENLSNLLSPGQQLIGIGQLIGGKDAQTINPSEIKRNLLVDNKGNRETTENIDITTSTEMNRKTTSSDIIHLTTFEPLVAMSQRMMTSKVNKADKVVFSDRIHAMDGNGIIKRKQNVARPMSQHYQQIQKIQSKLTQRQNSGQLREHGMGEMQRQQILQTTTDTIHENGYNNERQQKNRNGTLTSSHIERTSDMNREHFKENATVTTTVDQNGHKEVLNGDKKFIKQHQKDMHNSDNLKYENQIEKGIEDKENFESSKIEQILGTGGGGTVGAVRLVSSWHQDIERTGNKFLKAVSLKKTTKYDSEIVKKKKILHTLNTAKDSTSVLSDENFSVESSVNNPFQEENTAKPETHHTVNTENLPYTPDYITSKVASQSSTGIRMQSEQFSYSYGEPSLHRTESRLKLNKKISLDRSRISNGGQTHPGVPEVLAHHVNPNTNTSSSSGGLPPEQWLDVRTATGHPGLFIVIGLTFGMLTALGLIHVYRCRRPFGCQCTQQFHNHTHGYSPPTNGDYCNCNDEYYIELDQESQSSVQKDFLPMELLNSNSRRSDRYMHGW